MGQEIERLGHERFWAKRRVKTILWGLRIVRMIIHLTKDRTLIEYYRKEKRMEMNEIMAMQKEVIKRYSPD